MPTYVFKCEGCSVQKPFLVHETLPPEGKVRDPIRKHCPTCRSMTNWMLTSYERRDGTDRRSGLDRRSDR